MGTELITTAQMYWITRLTSLGNGLAFIIGLLFFLAVVFLITGIFLLDPMICDDDGFYKWGRRLIKTSPLLAVVATVLMIANCLLPTTKEMAAILIVPRVANSENVQTVGYHLYDLAVEWMEEMRPAKGNIGGEK